jgi:tetratricopeptide (TPR) repeat protein
MKGLTPTELGNQVEEEILFWQQQLQAKPDSHAFLPLAKAYCKAGRYAEAVETCRQGLSKHPYYWAARVILGQAYLEQGMLDEALAQLEMVVREVANNLLASRLLGQVYIKQGRLDEAIERYRISLNYHPECADLEEELHRVEVEKERRYKKTIQGLENWLKHIRAYRQLKAA